MKTLNPSDIKVMLVAYACAPNRGSEEGAGWAWSFELARLGYQVWCFTNFADKAETLAERDRLNLQNLHFVFVELGHLDEKLYDTASRKVYFHYRLWKQKAAKMAIQMHRDVKFHIGQHVSYGSLQQASFLWQIPGIRRIFGPVGGGQFASPVLKEYFGSSWRTEMLRSLISRYSISYNKALRKTIETADVVLTTNNETRQLAASIIKGDSNKFVYSRDSAILASMENLPFTERTPVDVLKLVWVGRVLPRKGLNLVLNALAYVPQRVNYHLTIVGGGPWFPKINEWISEYKLDKSRLEIMGKIPFSEVNHQYKNADVFIFCSLRDTFGSQLNEAMAFSLPIICLNMHGMASGVPDACSIKVDVTSKEQVLQGIAAAITRMHDDIAFRQSCSKAAYEYSLTNTWKSLVEDTTKKFYTIHEP